MKIPAPKRRTTRCKNRPSLRALLLTQGIGGTLDYLCTFSVFSVLSAA
jgi:hypothetical protein